MRKNTLLESVLMNMLELEDDNTTSNSTAVDTTKKRRTIRHHLRRIILFDDDTTAPPTPPTAALNKTKLRYGFKRVVVLLSILFAILISIFSSTTQSMRMLQNLTTTAISSSSKMTTTLEETAMIIMTTTTTDQLVQHPPQQQAMDPIIIENNTNSSIQQRAGIVDPLAAAVWNVTTDPPTTTEHQQQVAVVDPTLLQPQQLPMDVINLSKQTHHHHHHQHHDEPNNITAAVCFKTLFGDIDLGVVIQWAAYNALLGFDRIFMFYRPEVTKLPRWQELYNLPYVVLTEQTKGRRKNYFDQAGTEIMCLQDETYAALYDWVLVADVDEYLWFSDRVGIKEFLYQHRNMTYLSFGKQMHSLSNRIDFARVNHTINMTDSSIFAVSKYPFYMKHFCNSKRRKNDPICPQWWGRAKVMVRPQIHGYIKVHGTLGYDKLDGRTTTNATTTKHFHPSVAHFKEWPEIFEPHNVTQRNPERFTVTSQDEVHIHNMHTGFKPIGGDNGVFLVWNGTWQVEYDSHLQDWFDFVIQRGQQQQALTSNTS